MNLSTQTLFDLSEFSHPELWSPSDIPWSALDHLSEYLQDKPLGQIEIELSPGVHLVNPESIFIGKDCVIEPGSYIEGPCFLGEGTHVRFGAYIRSNVLTGKGCVIGHCTEVKGSILLNEAKAPHKAYVGDSILGNQVNLGAGTVLANLRLDRKNIRINSLETGRRKLGALVGDGAQIGCNCVTNPGTVVLKGSLIRPCKAVGGVINHAK